MQTLFTFICKAVISISNYILVLDQGTTSCRAILFDAQQQQIAMCQQETSQYYPASGWVEQDAEEIWRVQQAMMFSCLEQAGVSPSQLAGIGITNQRETTVLWDKQSGRPISRAIVWQCRRSAPLVDELVEHGWGDYIRHSTGLVPDAYFSATKLAWLLDNIPGCRERAERGELLFGTIDSWLLWKLTNGAAHATDYTNASRTMLYNIRDLCWDERLLDMLRIPAALLPEVKDSAHCFGYAELDGVQVPIHSLVGDQQAALFGQCCFDAGEAKNTYGTGCFLLVNTGSQLCESKHGLLTTIASGLDGRISYALEGSVFIGGAAVQWLRDGLRLIDNSRDIERISRQTADCGGVYLVPAFTGLGAPHWDMYARGCLLGLTQATTREQIIRATEESIAYQCYDLLQAMEADLGTPITSLKADGGASVDSFLLQFQTDISNRPVLRPALLEATARGAASLAGLSCGLWQNQAELRGLWQAESSFTPQMDDEQRTRLLHGWGRAVDRARGWAEPL